MIYILLEHRGACFRHVGYFTNLALLEEAKAKLDVEKRQYIVIIRKANNLLDESWYYT